MVPRLGQQESRIQDAQVFVRLSLPGVSGCEFQVSSCRIDLQRETRNKEFETPMRDTLHASRVSSATPARDLLDGDCPVLLTFVLARTPQSDSLPSRDLLRCVPSERTRNVPRGEVRSSESEGGAESAVP